MKVLHLPVIILLFSVYSCINPKIVNTSQLNFLNKDAFQWSLEECQKIIDFYTADNTGGELFKSGLTNQKVYIRSMPLNTATIKAISRKEVIEKRLKDDDYYSILNNYLNTYMGYEYDPHTKKIAALDEKFSKGYVFKVIFENISDPYEPIFLDEGYSYFFLENFQGEFSRVTEVTGLYVEDYFQLDSYLNTIITFSPFSSNDKKMFSSSDLNESYKLVFNGLQNTPIIIEWQLHN